MEIYPGQAPVNPQEAYLNCHDATRKTYTHAMYKRMDSEPPTLHLLPIDGKYEAKPMENGEPLFVMQPQLKLKRDDVVIRPRDPQHRARK